jgi:hypothetical protein
VPWFKIDDTFAMHEKVMAAGNSAIGLWARAGAWSMQQLTDGFVPDHVLRALGTPKERRTLVEVSLWTEAEGGITFRNWSERQPTKEQVEAARQAAAERQRHARERAKSQRESRRDTGVSHGPPDPTRPDPTPKSNRAAAADREAEEEFAAFWATYPKKKDKGHAVKAYRAARKKASDVEILTGLRRQLPEWANGDAKFIPLAATWLNGERWTDEPDNVHQLRTDDQGRTILPPLPSRSPWGN